MAATDPFATLGRALDQTASIIAHVGADQAHLPTPCAGWDVHTLVNHTVYDLQIFKAGIAGGERGSPDTDLIGDDWAKAFRTAADELMAAWRSRGAEGTITSPMGKLPATWAIGQHLADEAVHGWDIARATGQSTELDPEVGQAGLDWARANLKPEYRGKTFGPEVEVPESAPIYDRLAGFFGRNPNAT